MAHDNGGVKLIRLTFSTTVNLCTAVSEAGHSGVYIANPQAQFPPESSAFAPNGMGLVPTSLFTASNLQGPFTCTVPGILGTARPCGQTVTAFVSATTYSNKTTTAALPITFGG